MDTELLYKASIFLLARLFAICLDTVYSAEVKLTDGQSPNQGRVDVKFTGEEWRPLRDGCLGNNEVKVVCRQLGYQYGVIQAKVYDTTIPDFLSDKFNCSGQETGLGECTRSPGPGISPQTKYHYAGVCCSNSSQFQAKSNDIVIGQCSVTWKEALQRCEEKNMAFSWSNGLGVTSGSNIWTGEFFTPWIWSDGCYTTDGATIQNRSFFLSSPQACMQFCGDKPNTQFALSGHECICLGQVGSNALVPQAEQARCHYPCQDNNEYKCGDGIGKYWNLFSLARQDDVFYTVANPVSRSQCAVLLAEGFTYDKLRSEECSQENGFICKEIHNKGRVIYKNFVGGKNLQKARQWCALTTTFRLAGRSVLDPSALQNKEWYNRKWVNIERKAIPVQTSTKVSGKLSPSLCISVDQTTAAQGKWRATPCGDANMYTCIIAEESPPDKKTSKTTGSSSTDNSSTSTTTGISVAPIVKPSSHSLPVIPIVVAVAGLVVLLAVVAIVVVCCMRTRRKQSNERQRQAPANNVADGRYEPIQRDPDSKEGAGFYEEIANEDAPAENLYYELEEPKREETKQEAETVPLHDYVNEDDVEKTPLKEKISYAFPKDSVKEKHSSDKSKEPVDRTKSNVSYDTPYDALLKRKAEGKQSSENETSKSEGTLIE